MKPSTCLDKKCSGGESCSACINRNIIAKEGYDLIRIIECVPASVEQTAAVNSAERFIKIAEDLLQTNIRIRSVSAQNVGELPLKAEVWSSYRKSKT